MQLSINMGYKQNTVSAETRDYKVTYSTEKQSAIPASDLVLLHNAKAEYADEALKLIKIEVQHRHVIENRQVDNQQSIIANQRISIACAFLSTIIMVISAVFLAIRGNEIVASVLVGGSLAAVIAAFIKKY
jgi:uncharacterized membrane protein